MEKDEEEEETVFSSRIQEAPCVVLVNPKLMWELEMSYEG
jgi:hypothetical protein